MEPKQRLLEAELTALEEAFALEERYGRLEPEQVIARSLDRFEEGEVAAVSSFGADSAILLHMIAAIDRHTPIVFLDTGKHFGETLHRSDTDACCAIRKVEPMTRGVAPFRAWFTGRKRFQSAARNGMPVFEAVGERIRINPLAHWDTSKLAAYMRRHDLRENPLVAFGYLSIGCFPCTEPARAGDDIRSGRWAGLAKTECGIHLTGLEASLASSRLLETPS
jgi:phosphoadenosine phosphosulfate reductase